MVDVLSEAEGDRDRLEAEANDGYDFRLSTDPVSGSIDASISKEDKSIFGIHLDGEGRMFVNIPASNKNRVEILAHLTDSYGDFGRVSTDLMTEGGLLVVDSPDGVIMMGRGEGEAGLPSLGIVVNYPFDKLEERIVPLKELVKAITNVPLATNDRAFDRVLVRGRIAQQQAREAAEGGSTV